MIGESSGNTIDATTCRWCGCIHSGTCRRVEEIEYYPNGTIKRVKFRGSSGGETRTITVDPSPTIAPYSPPNTCGSVTSIPRDVQVTYTS